MHKLSATEIKRKHLFHFLHVTQPQKVNCSSTGSAYIFVPDVFSSASRNSDRYKYNLFSLFRYVCAPD